MATIVWSMNVMPTAKIIAAITRPRPASPSCRRPSSVVEVSSGHLPAVVDVGIVPCSVTRLSHDGLHAVMGPDGSSPVLVSTANTYGPSAA